MAEFRMPTLGADMEAGTLVEWRVKPGDAVKRGDIVAVVETQKGAIEVEIWETGVIQSLTVPIGDKVPVGTVLAIVRETSAPQAAPAPGVAPVAPVAPESPTPVVSVAPSATQATSRRAAPAARRRARELGVDLEHVVGTGPGNAITVEDIVRAAAPAGGTTPPTAAPSEPEKGAAMRMAIAAAMARSKREIPHYYLATQIDMHASLEWLARENLERPVTERILPVVLLVKAVARALKQAPEMNGFWVDDRFKPGPGVHIGVAISLRQGGLIAPTLHDVDRRSIGELMRDLADLIRRTRAGALRSSELSDSTITVTSLGDQGVETIFGVIYPPQVALVGFGTVTERAVPRDGQIALRRAITATLAADHRASDGHRGAVFLSAINRQLQEPGQL